MKHHPAGVYQIWKEAFHDDDSYIDLFLHKGLPLGHLLTYGPSDSPYAALTLFPITLQIAGVSYSGYYLYALGTLLSERGKGYGTTLLTTAEEYAMHTGRQFILLQPTNHHLFKYYYTLGYHSSVFRTLFTCSKTALRVSSVERENLLHLLTKLSISPERIPTASNYSFDRFIWPTPLRKYITEECLFRGGSVLYGAYCYPNIDLDGPFLEIKEMNTSTIELPMLVEAIFSAFPHIERFVFWGKPQMKTILPLSIEAFALIHFFNPELQKLYHPQSTFFALGLD